MNAITTVLSSVGSFFDTTKNQYSLMLALADEILQQVNGMLVFVQGERSKIEKQILQVQIMEETISEKVYMYSVEAEYARSDDLYRHWEEKYISAQAVQNAVEEQSEKIRQLATAIAAVADALERNVFEIRKYMSLIRDEAAYNVQSLMALVESIQTYVTSKEIFSTYEIARASDRSSTFAGAGYEASGQRRERRGTAGGSHKYKIKSTQTIEQYFAREGQKKPIYRRFNVYAPPVKQMLLQSTMTMGPAFQQYILKQLEGVVFLNAKHGFTYSATNKNGATIRIIGMNFTDPSYSRNLLKHVAHHIYLAKCTREAVTMNNLAAREAQINMRHANQRIQDLSREITAKIPVSRRRNVSRPTSGSRFFASCFEAYVNQDQEFLNTVKESYGESYRLFSDIVGKMPNGGKGRF